MNEIFNHVGKSCWDCECVFEEGDSSYPEYSHLQEGLRFLCPKCYSKSMSLYRAIINWIKYRFHIHEWKLIDIAEKRQAMGLSGRECFNYYTFQCVICKSHKKEKP